MDEKPATATNTETKGTPMGVALAWAAGLVILAVLLLAGALIFTFGSNAKLKRQIRQDEEQRLRADRDREQAADAARLALARNRQDEVLVQARNATNALERSLLAANQPGAWRTAG